VLRGRRSDGHGPSQIGAVDDEALGSACEPHAISDLIREGCESLARALPSAGQAGHPRRSQPLDFSLAPLARHVTLPMLSNAKKQV